MIFNLNGNFNDNLNFQKFYFLLFSNSPLIFILYLLLFLGLIGRVFVSSLQWRAKKSTGVWRSQIQMPLGAQSRIYYVYVIIKTLTTSFHIPLGCWCMSLHTLALSYFLSGTWTSLSFISSSFKYLNMSWVVFCSASVCSKNKGSLN